MMRNDVLKAKELVQIAFDNVQHLTTAKIDTEKELNILIQEAEQIFHDALGHLQATHQNLQMTLHL